MAEHRCFGVFFIIKPMNITLGPGVHVVAVTSTQWGDSTWIACSESKVLITLFL